MKKLLFALFALLCISNTHISAEEKSNFNESIVVDDAKATAENVATQLDKQLPEKTIFELFKGYWVEAWTFNLDEKGEKAVNVLKVVAGDLSGILYTGLSSEEASKVLAENLKIEIDKELSDLLAEPVTKQTKEITLFHTRKDDYSLLVQRKTVTDTRANFNIIFATDKDLYDYFKDNLKEK